MKSVFADLNAQLDNSQDVIAHGPTELLDAAIEQVSGGEGKGWIKGSDGRSWSLNGGTENMTSAN